MFKNMARIGVCLLLVFGVAGCGSSPDGLMKKQIRLLNDFADAIENDAPQSRMDELQKEGEALNQKMEKLDLSPDEKKELRERHKPEIEAALGRLRKAMFSKAMKGKGFNLPNFGGLK